MAASTVNLRYFVLGLLTHKPMSGYDIKLFFKSLGWLVGDPSFGAIYPALHGLLEEGLVTVKVLPSLTKPPRKIYNVTLAGSQALQEWVDQPVTASASLKSFVMRLILANNLTSIGLMAHLQQRRAQVADHQAALEEAIRNLDAARDMGRRLALDYSMAIAHAELAWLDSALERLRSGSSIRQVTESDPASTS